MLNFVKVFNCLLNYCHTMDGMDRRIENKGLRKKHIWLGVTVLIFLLVLIHVVFGDKSSKLNVDQDRISIGEVQADKYQDYISVNGSVEPIQTIYLDAVESGRVEGVLIEEGTKGQ